MANEKGILLRSFSALEGIEHYRGAFLYVVKVPSKLGFKKKVKGPTGRVL